MDLKRVDSWHLHVTVVPRSRDVMGGYSRTCESVKWTPTVIENLPSSVHELIPTFKTTCELGRALILLHDAAKFFVMAEWLVPRVKIEGRVQSDESMYCETHVVVPESSDDSRQPNIAAHAGLPLSRSLTSGKLYATLRSRDASPEAITDYQRDLLERGLFGTKTEWTAYDSNRALDRPWFVAWGRTE